MQCNIGFSKKWLANDISLSSILNFAYGSLQDTRWREINCLMLALRNDIIFFLLFYPIWWQRNVLCIQQWNWQFSKSKEKKLWAFPNFWFSPLLLFHFLRKTHHDKDKKNKYSFDIKVRRVNWIFISETTVTFCTHCINTTFACH